MSHVCGREENKHKFTEWEYLYYIYIMSGSFRISFQTPILYFPSITLLPKQIQELAIKWFSGRVTKAKLSLWKSRKGESRYLQPLLPPSITLPKVDTLSCEKNITWLNPHIYVINLVNHYLCQILKVRLKHVGILSLLIICCSFKQIYLFMFKTWDLSYVSELKSIYEPGNTYLRRCSKLLTQITR